MTYRGVSAAVVQLLASARSNGVLINRTKLAKLLYLADLRAVDQGMAPGTQVEWLWRHYGPYSNVLRSIESDLELAGVLQVVETVNYYGTPEMRLRLAAEVPQMEIDAQFAAIVDSMVETYGHFSASQLKDLTYQTAPMQAAQKAGRREVRLDLAGGDPLPDLEPTLSRLRMIAEDLPPLEDDAEGVQELAKEIEDWEPLRREAVGQMLDGE